nr:Thioredoxin-like fold protein [Ipomoea batatas]
MACKNGEFENPKMKGGSYFNRSMTIHHGGGSAAAVKPSVERLGSFKQLPGSSAFEAMVSVAGSSIKGKDRVVIYFTSLRGIRRTFEDCYTVRMILKSFRVHVDERDISMDSAYKKELQSILGSKNVTLPQVFIKGNYIGGAEVIKQMNEVGELSRLLRGLPIRPPGFVCQGCGDARFIPCSNCNGSRKLFDEDEEQLRRCPDCNENGLVRCPLCCG